MPDPTPNPDVATSCRNAALAFDALRTLPPTDRATILDAIATALETRRADILSTTAEETALTIDELTPEFARMTGTLRMFAALIREGSWVRASIDTPASTSGPNPDLNPNRNLPLPLSPALIGPNHDLRKLLTPLGPVAVFGSSNFPLAYGVCGGDTASALAAGCPVIIKEHPAHPRTGRLLASIAQDAIQQHRERKRATNSPDSLDILQYIHNENPKDFSVAQHFVQDLSITAVGFTGSIPGGLAIEKLARERAIPIPVFAEMGSNNLIIISRSAAAARAESIADELAASILQRFGQQCTCPGTIVVEVGEAGTRFVQLLAECIRSAPGREMLAPWIKSSYERRLSDLQQSPGVRILAQGATHSGPRGTHACLLGASDDYTTLVRSFEKGSLRDEVFGPAAVVVRLPIDMIHELRPHASLTCCIYAEPAEMRDDWTFSAALCTASTLAGRIIFNGPPTGVRVATSMVHGGPFPATNAPHTTAVGPLAIERWCRPICFQNCPDALLPPELRSANPLNIWRTINGELTRSPIP